MSTQPISGKGPVTRTGTLGAGGPRRIYTNDCPVGDNGIPLAPALAAALIAVYGDTDTPRPDDVVVLQITAPDDDGHDQRIPVLVCTVHAAPLDELAYNATIWRTSFDVVRGPVTTTCYTYNVQAALF